MKNDFTDLLTTKTTAMTFLFIVFAIRFVFMLLDKIGRKENEFNRNEYEDGPTEHNVWW